MLHVRPIPSTVSALLVLAGLAGSAQAQGLVTTKGTIVAYVGDAVPDANGTPISGLTFGGSSALADNPVLDESGRILFRARLIDNPLTLTPINERAYFYGSSRSDLRLVVQGGDQAPGMAPGVLLRTAGGISSSLTAAVRLSPDGRLWWGSNVDDGAVTITSANSEALFGGPFGSQSLLVQKGDAAPGTVGASFNQAFVGISPVTAGMNRNGRLFFMAALTGGDVVTTSGLNNQTGLFAGLPGALELVARKGNPVSGLGGAVAVDTFSTMTTLLVMNDADQLLYDVALSTTQGGATATNDRALMVHVPGGPSTVLVREGDSAPGTSPSATFNAISGDAWAPGQSGNCWTRLGTTCFVSDLRGGDVVAGVNDRAVFTGGVGTLALAVRKGDAAPGTDGVFANFATAGCMINAAGRLSITASLSGGTTTSANDSGIWTGLPGALTLVVREGQVMPGTGGSVAGAFSLTSSPTTTTTYFNDQSRCLFNVSLTGGTTTGTSLWTWDPAFGLAPVVLNGDSIEVNPAVFRTVNGFGAVQPSNTDGASLHFGHDSVLGLRVSFTDNTQAQLVVRLAEPNPVSICSNSTLGTDHATACPCGNVGLAGNGCAHSFSVDGANLGSSGVPANDDVILLSSNTPASSFTLFMQHDAVGDAVFHDGVLCAGGTLTRLRGRNAVAGLASFPNSNFANDTQTLSQRGGVVVGSGALRYYSAFYRNASTTFCPPATANVSNGLKIIW